MNDRARVARAGTKGVAKSPSPSTNRVDVEPQTGFYELPLGTLLWHLRLTERSVQKALRQALLRTSLTKAQFGVMQVLDRVQAASSAALARTLTVSPQAMVGVIAGLEGKGFIKRNSTPSTSARVLVAQVTPSGRRAFAKAATRFEIIDTALDSAFSDAERQRLISLLSKMREVFEELDGSLSSDP